MCRLWSYHFSVGEWPIASKTSKNYTWQAIPGALVDPAGHGQVLSPGMFPLLHLQHVHGRGEVHRGRGGPHLLPLRLLPRPRPHLCRMRPSHPARGGACRLSISSGRRATWLVITLITLFLSPVVVIRRGGSGGCHEQGVSHQVLPLRGRYDVGMSYCPHNGFFVRHFYKFTTCNAKGVFLEGRA